MPTSTSTMTTKAAGTEGLKIFEGFLSKRKVPPKKTSTPATASSNDRAKAAGAAAGAAAAAAAVTQNKKQKTQTKAEKVAAAASAAKAAAIHLSNRGIKSFAQLPTKVRLMILQQLPTEKDILTFLQVEGACRDVLYIYPEAVFGRFRRIDNVPWIRAFPAKRDLFIRRSWHSSSGRWALVHLENRKRPCENAQQEPGRTKQPRRSDALLLDLKSKALVKSRIVHPFPHDVASTSMDALREWCDIISAHFTSNEKYVATTSRRLTCVCECAKSSIIASRQHPASDIIGEVERSIVTNDGRFVILVGNKEVHIYSTAKPTQDMPVAVIRQPRAQNRQLRQCRYLPNSDVLIVGTMGVSLECWDLSSRLARPQLFYRLCGPLIEPDVIMEPPIDPLGRKVLLVKRDSTGNAGMIDIGNAPANAKEKRNVRQWRLIHNDIASTKRWEYSADGRWLMAISDSCCAHLLRMWDLTADYTAPGENAAHVDPAVLFKTKDVGSLQYRGTVGNYIIAVTYTSKSDVADKIFVLDTKSKAVKTILNSGKHVTRGCPGEWTISPDGGCMATTCEASDEVWAWLVPNASNTVPPQSKLNNHRRDPLTRESLNQAGRDILTQVKRMQRSQINAKAAINEYFIVTDRTSLLIPSQTSSFFVKKMKEKTASLQAKDPSFTLKLTRRVVDHLWETLRLLLLRKYHTNLDLRQLDVKDVERLSVGLSTLNGIPSVLFAAALEIISMDLLFRNPIEFRKQYATVIKSVGPGQKAKGVLAGGKKKALPPSSSKAKEEGMELLNLLDNHEALTESLWLHRPSLHLLGKTAVIELLMEDYAATENHSVWFSDDGNWVLGGSRIYNVQEAYGYLSAKESVESECLEAVDRLNDIIDRLSCPCQNCADISNSLTALMNSAGV